MQLREVRDLRIALPGFEPGELDPVSVPVGGPGPGVTWTGDLDRARVKTGGGTGTRIADSRLRRCHLAELDFAGSVWEDVAATDCLFERVDFTGAQLTGLRLERCHLLGCRFTRARLAESQLEHVLFEDCRLDGTVLDDVQTDGPVGFVGSVLVDAVVRDSRLDRTAFDGCRLRQVTFVSCDLRGADLRGNRLAGISGVSSLRGVTIEPAQLSDLTEAVIRDLDLTLRGPRR